MAAEAMIVRRCPGGWFAVRELANLRAALQGYMLRIIE
jgi:hypothetical protein